MLIWLYDLKVHAHKEVGGKTFPLRNSDYSDITECNVSHLDMAETSRLYISQDLNIYR